MHGNTIGNYMEFKIQKKLLRQPIFLITNRLYYKCNFVNGHAGRHSCQRGRDMEHSMCRCGNCHDNAAPGVSLTCSSAGGSRADKRQIPVVFVNFSVSRLRQGECFVSVPPLSGRFHSLHVRCGFVLQPYPAALLPCRSTWRYGIRPASCVCAACHMRAFEIDFIGCRWQ